MTSNLRIGLVGYGKMGQLIAELAQKRNWETVSIDPHNPSADFATIDDTSLHGVDVCIEFTHPKSALTNIELIASHGKAMVIGTTGWYDQLEQVKSIVSSHSVGLLYASNFSLGVNIFFELTRLAGKIANKFSHYDVAGIEYHHNQKADSPSGTALSLAQILLEEVDRKRTITSESLDRPIKPEELHFTSVRCGSFPGLHQIVLDSEADTITLQHNARTRHGFAEGSLVAAEWLKNKQGLFTFQDVMVEILGQI